MLSLSFFSPESAILFFINKCPFELIRVVVFVCDQITFVKCIMVIHEQVFRSEVCLSACKHQTLPAAANSVHL